MAEARDERAITDTAPRGTLNETRWDEVIAVAAQVFGEKGYRGATLQDIASRLGMLKGSLYYYIQSKEDLLFEILLRAHQKGVEFVTEPEVVRRATPPARMEWLIRNWMTGLESLPPALQISESDMGHLQGPRRTEIVALRRQIRSVPREIIAAGVADGSFRADVDPSLATVTIMTLLNSTSRWYRVGGRVDWQQLVDWYVALVMGGLRSGGTPEPDRGQFEAPTRIKR